MEPLGPVASTGQVPDSPNQNLKVPLNLGMPTEEIAHKGEKAEIPDRGRCLTFFCLLILQPH